MLAHSSVSRLTELSGWKKKRKRKRKEKKNRKPLKAFRRGERDQTGIAVARSLVFTSHSIDR